MQKLTTDYRMTIIYIIYLCFFCLLSTWTLLQSYFLLHPTHFISKGFLSYYKSRSNRNNTDRNLALTSVKSIFAIIRHRVRRRRLTQVKNVQGLKYASSPTIQGRDAFPLCKISQTFSIKYQLQKLHKIYPRSTQKLFTADGKALPLDRSPSLLCSAPAKNSFPHVCSLL